MSFSIIPEFPSDLKTPNGKRIPGVVLRECVYFPPTDKLVFLTPLLACYLKDPKPKLHYCFPKYIWENTNEAEHLIKKLRI
jgi:hypothetical protein